MAYCQENGIVYAQFERWFKSFYRMRLREEDKQFTYKDMMPIPDDKRYLVKVVDYHNPYKSAYLIPQLIMEWLTTYNGATIQDLKGVRYTSVHVNDQVGYPQEAFKNLALPVPRIKSPSFAKPLSDLFKLTEPTCEKYERIKFHLGPDIIYLDAFDKPDGR